MAPAGHSHSSSIPSILSSEASSSSLTAASRWEPLPKIQYGMAISPFAPESNILPQANELLDPTSAAALQAHLIGLEVGDEVYVFEQLGADNPQWLRGYVVSTNRMPTSATSPSSLSGYSTFPGTLHQFAGASLVEEPQVFVGVYPAAYVHIREQVDDAEMRLADLYAKSKEQKPTAISMSMSSSSSGPSTSLPKPQMETLPEEDESASSVPNSPLITSKSNTPAPEAERQSRGLAFRSDHDHHQELDNRPAPPLPSLKCGDETLSGNIEPLVDEIACALREWSSLIYTYLSKRDYTLFHAVKQHIDVLYMARKQLMAQTLSEEETTKLRRDCVARLVKGNVAQGLDVIVRHPGRGGLVDADFHSSDADVQNWVSGIRLYALQVALAYVEQTTADSLVRGGPGATGLSALDPVATSIGGTTSQPVSATNNNTSRTSMTLSRSATSKKRQPRLSITAPGSLGSDLLNDLSASSGSISPSPTTPVTSTNTQPSVKYYHVYLDLRAFVASPCGPGEGVELYFSLYNKAESRFLTEEFCIVLNHQGAPVGSTDGRPVRMCTLFSDLSANDMQDLNIVCRIVRNGAMRFNHAVEPRSAGTAASSIYEGDSSGGHGSNSLTSSVFGSSNGPYAGSPGFRNRRMTSDRAFRRPFGCAVLSLGQDHQFETETSSSSSKREHMMPIFVPVKEAAFSTLHQDIIASRIREFEKSPRADLIVVDVKVFHGETSSLIRENPSLLTSIPLTARLGFPDVVFPGDKRNEAYIKLWSGEFYPSGNKLPGGSSAKNIQVSIEVRKRDGSVLEDVISRGSGEPNVTQFDSAIFYHQNAPTWGELLKLELPHELMEQCHLFLSFRHRSSKEEKLASTSPSTPSTPNQPLSGTSTGKESPVSAPFAHAYLPLFGNNAAFIQDGSHTLLLWRSSRPAQNLSPELYFALPATIPFNRTLADVVPSSLTNIIQPLRDTVVLRSFLVSTRYTQNDVLLRLLNWEKVLSEDLEELMSVLVTFTFVGEVEIVKFLADIFDALFAIVVNPRNSGGKLDDLVFNALVTVLGIVQDRRFNNFRATLDVYIEKHFQSQTAHSRILSSMSRLLTDPSRPDTSQQLRASIKVWPYLFKLVIRSRENQRLAKDAGGDNTLGGEAVGDHLETKFRSDLDGVLSSINRLMSATSPPSIVGTQALALQHFAGILLDLARVYEIEDLIRIETAFADSVFITTGRMVVWKLLHIVQVADGPLFNNHTSRSQLIPSIVRWIRPHLGSYSEGNETSVGEQEAARDTARITWMESARLAVTVLAITLDRLQTGLFKGRQGELSPAEVRQEQDNVDYVLSMMPRILETYKELDSRACIKSLERHRSASTIASTIPVIFPSSYPFPLIAKQPEGHQKQMPPANTSRRQRQSDRFEFLNCGLGEVASVLSMLVMLSPRKHLAGFLEEQLDLEGPEKLAKFLSDFFEVASSILLNEAFPATWLNVNILAHQMVLKMADPLAALMVRDFIPTAEESALFNTDLWESCLNMLLTLLSSEQLVIEQFKPQRRRAVWRLAGDIRGEGAQIFAKLWNSIGWPDSAAAPDLDPADPKRLNTGGFQVQFVPSLVEPVLELCLSHHDELRTCAVRVLATMITSEWHLNGNFSVIEAEIIDKLDVLFMSDTKGDEISRAFFIGQLRSLFESPEVDTKLQEQVFACLMSVNRFLDLLLDVRSLPLEEGFEDDRIAGTLKLLGFLRQANRVTAFSTHVLRLVNMHLTNQNFVEAALTLKLHADLHSWDMDSFVEPIEELSLPRQSQFARRETLYMLILEYLGKGEAWEISVDICRDLAQQYEYRAVDYTRLAEVLDYQSTLFRKIATIERSFPSYFRVAYYGEQWPRSIQQKMFVYRGLDWEKYPAFCERFHQNHPSATLLKNSKSPSDDIRFADAQYLQITALQAEPDRTRDVFTNPDVPPLVRSYYEHNGTSLFSFTRPLGPSEAGGSASESVSRSSDLAELWVEKTYLRCEDALPTVLRRSEVAELHVVQISPLENALNDIEAKTQELVGLQRKYSGAAPSESTPTAVKVNTNRLAMALNGAVDAPVNGGIPLYKSAFLSEAFTEANQDKTELVTRLREAIQQQAVVLHRCLKLHARLCPAEMQPFHETLERFFAQNFAEEVTELGLPLDSNATSDGGFASSAGPESQSHFQSSQGGDESSSSGKRGQFRSAYGFSSAGGMKLDVPTSVVGNAQAGPTTYALDANSRLRRVPYDAQEALASAQSPLQKHIASLAKQAQTKSGDGGGLNRNSNVTPGIMTNQVPVITTSGGRPLDGVISSESGGAGIGSAPLSGATTSTTSGVPPPSSASTLYRGNSLSQMRASFNDSRSIDKGPSSGGFGSGSRSLFSRYSNAAGGGGTPDGEQHQQQQSQKSSTPSVSGGGRLTRLISVRKSGRNAN
ncbi:unnamed protein product [Sympodiomycopsis kandeliae]